MTKERGRPTIYTDELATQICDLLAEGKSMIKACEAIGISRRTVASWLQTKPDFAEMTIHARAEWTDDIVDQLIDIAGDTSMDHHTRRLLSDNIKWVAGKQRPKKYNDRLIVDHSGAIKHNVAITDMTDEELEAIAAGRSAGIAGEA